jgi:hypothetical protein
MDHKDEEIKNLKQANLRRQKFVNILKQPPSMFTVVREPYGLILKCNICESKGGTLSLSHNVSCPYTNTQVWYKSDGYTLSIYDVAMFDYRRRF